MAKKLHQPNFIIGAFAENSAVQHLTEADLCIEDIFHIGEAITQVSQPRQPCWKIKDLAIQIQQQGMTGWYFRVLKEGDIQAGDYLQLQEGPFPEWTVAKCNDITHNQKNKI